MFQMIFQALGLGAFIFGTSCLEVVSEFRRRGVLGFRRGAFRVFVLCRAPQDCSCMVTAVVFEDLRQEAFPNKLETELVEEIRQPAFKG